MPARNANAPATHNIRAKKCTICAASSRHADGGAGLGNTFGPSRVSRALAPALLNPRAFADMKPEGGSAPGLRVTTPSAPPRAVSTHGAIVPGNTRRRQSNLVRREPRWRVGPRVGHRSDAAIPKLRPGGSVVDPQFVVADCRHEFSPVSGRGSTIRGRNGDRRTVTGSDQARRLRNEPERQRQACSRIVRPQRAAATGSFDPKPSTGCPRSRQGPWTLSVPLHPQEE